jgi:uncharacterized protein
LVSGLKNTKSVKNALLWRIQAKNAPVDARVSWLFGTIHVRDARVFERMEALKPYIDQSNVFATEFAFDETDHAVLASALRLPDGRTLDKMLPAGRWKQLLRLNERSAGLTLPELRDQHPMRAATLLTADFMNEEMPASLDEALWEYARTAGKTTTGVETFREQMEILQKIPMQQHLTNLSQLLKNHRAQKRRTRKMLDWYRAGELQKLYRAARKSAGGLRNLLLYERNTIMARRFADIANTHALFCAVGAGHLAGQKGMLRLLKKRGFSVKPVF